MRKMAQHNRGKILHADPCCKCLCLCNTWPGSMQSILGRKYTFKKMLFRPWSMHHISHNTGGTMDGRAVDNSGCK